MSKQQGPLSNDEHNFRVSVKQRPFGMNVQTHVLPRVVEVLPGYPAEAAGVKRGFVIIAVNDKPVDASNWFTIWQKAAVPSTLTFDTNVPLHEENPYFGPVKTGGSGDSAVATHEDVDADEGFTDFRCNVKSLPFGMQVKAPPGGRPTVAGVVEGHPASKEGIRVGDVLVEVAGRPVDATNWFAAFQQAVPPFGLHFRRPVTAAERDAGRLEITVTEKPFGMHIRRGTAIVEEVFPGFPAHKLGIRKGCEVQSIAGKSVAQGTWLEDFRVAAVPFTLALFCPEKSSKSEGPLSNDEHQYRVLVARRPFGMNVQVNLLPRVIEVLPGYPAEAAGVKRGFVLTAINDKPVDASNWFNIWQKVKIPCTLTFDTNVPLNKNNPFFNPSAAPGTFEAVAAAPGPDSKAADESDVGAGFSDFRCKVDKLPFGMYVNATPGHRPAVQNVVSELPAAKVGVHVGDLLVEVAGLPVDSSTWFAAFQQAVPPFGLRFRRPVNAPSNANVVAEKEAVSPPNAANAVVEKKAAGTPTDARADASEAANAPKGASEVAKEEAADTPGEASAGANEEVSTPSDSSAPA